VPEYGSHDIVATPHANTSYHYEPELISQRIAELQNAAGNGIKIHRGCDFHLSPHNLQFAAREPSRFSINGLNYLLVEFPEMAMFQGIEQVFSNHVFRIDAHCDTPGTERAPGSGHPARLRRWVEQGIPLQITAQSLLGTFGTRAAQWCLQLLNDGLVHFVASDAHDLVPDLLGWLKPETLW
jgi:protein-tyrosine phosphatase